MKRLVWLAVTLSLLSTAIAIVRLGYPAPAKAQAACSLGTLQGTYGFHLQGWIVDDQSHAQVPIVEVGTVVADGSGNLKAAATLNQGGQVVKIAFNFTYQVNADCSGSLTPLPDSAGAGPSDFVLADGGKQLMVVVTQPGVVLSGTGVRQ